MSAPPKVIAEIGCNHRGDMAVAREMIGIAATFCKADYVKFQKRNNRELLTPEQYAAPHPNPQHAYGETYGAHREYLELNLDQHRELKDFCEQFKIGYATSVWDLSSAKEICTLRPDFIKIPSATNQHFGVLGYLCDEFHGQVHCSLGMTSAQEIQQMIEFFERKARSRDLVIYACTSAYPVQFEDLCLREIERLRAEYRDRGRVAAVGFSGHHLGIAADIAAQTLGAEWIERHFTLDRTWKGTDHAASLEPDGLRRLCRDTRAIARALEYKPSDPLPVEQAQRKKLKWWALRRALRTISLTLQQNLAVSSDEEAKAPCRPTALS